MFLVPATAERAAKNGPLFIVLNTASGAKDSGEERQILADVFNSAGRAFEFLQFDNPADIDRLDFHFLFHFLSGSPVDKAAMKASCGTSTLPTIFIRFLPSFCFSSSLRLREISPP